MAKDEGHGFAKKSNADFQFYATVMFVRRYLLDEQIGTRRVGLGLSAASAQVQKSHRTPFVLISLWLGMTPECALAGEPR